MIQILEVSYCITDDRTWIDNLYVPVHCRYCSTQAVVRFLCGQCGRDYEHRLWIDPNKPSQVREIIAQKVTVAYLKHKKSMECTANRFRIHELEQGLYQQTVMGRLLINGTDVGPTSGNLSYHFGGGRYA